MTTPPKAVRLPQVAIVVTIAVTVAFPLTALADFLEVRRPSTVKWTPMATRRSSSDRWLDPDGTVPRYSDPYKQHEIRGTSIGDRLNRLLPPTSLSARSRAPLGRVFPRSNPHRQQFPP